MLGGERTFNDKLCWILVLPLSILALWAVDVAFLALEVAVEGEAPGSARWWVAPLMSLGAGYGAVLMGAKVAPARKTETAAALSALYLVATAVSVVHRARQGAGAAWLAVLALLAVAGCALAVWRARSLPPEDAEAVEASE